MSLRDRIAHLIEHTVSPWGCAGEILADPEIAARFDLAACAVSARDHLAGLSIADDIDAALARLEEARR